MFDITLKVDQAMVLRKDLVGTVTLTYQGMSEDKSNLVFSLYHRQGVSKETDEIVIPVDNLDKYVDLGVPPYKIRVTEFDENSLECYISGMMIQVTTYYPPIPAFILHDFFPFFRQKNK